MKSRVYPHRKYNQQMPANNGLALNDMKARSGVAIPEDRKLLPKDQILKDKLSQSAQQRSERSCNDPQQLDHRRETNRSRQKKAIESTRTNIQEGQGAKPYVAFRAFVGIVKSWISIRCATPLASPIR